MAARKKKRPLRPRKPARVRKRARKGATRSHQHPELVGVYPIARRVMAPHAAFSTLLMSTGLTFGTISSLYGLNSGIIDRTQFSLLLAVVVLSAIVPTVIAQRFFQPSLEPELSSATTASTPIGAG